VLGEGASTYRQILGFEISNPRLSSVPRPQGGKSSVGAEEAQARFVALRACWGISSGKEN